MHRGRAFLGSADMQTAGIKLDLMPLQIAHLRSPEAMAIGDQNHRCIAMAVAIALGSSDQALDLAFGKIAALDCEVFGVWCGAIASLICHEKSLSGYYDWKDNSLFIHICELGICLLFFISFYFCFG